MCSSELCGDPKFKFEKESFVWKRPCEIHDDPKFIHDGVSRFDLHQGALADCWFIAAAATLATRPELFKRVVPEGQHFGPDSDGTFRFNFWRYGEWIKVVIDDRLPTKDGKLVYCGNRTTTEEFWPALLEKAYAKLVGSYKALEYGWSQDALVDFTGGIGQKISLKKAKPQDFYKFLQAQNNMSTLMGCTFQKSPGMKKATLQNGLVAGHAYSITSIKLVMTKEGEKQLLRLRNPWGKHEWNGAWSDKKMDAAMRQELGLEIKDDGEFWMSYQDWLTHFQIVELCHLPPDVKLEGRRQWKEIAFHGSWEIKGSYTVAISGSQSGGRKDKMNTVIISLMQKCAQQYRVHMVLNLFQVLQPQNLWPIRRLVCQYREISDSISLPDGYYVINASTCEPYVKGNYLLRIYTDGCVRSSN